jgi:hypothetical protein
MPFDGTNTKGAQAVRVIDHMLEHFGPYGHGWLDGHHHTGSQPVRLETSAATYRELATKIRKVAWQSRLPVARRELLRLATSYDQRAGHLDQRMYYW